MPVSNLIEKLGRAIFEAPFGGPKISKDAPELAEIRLAVLDAVKAKSHRASGKNIFPYNLVRLHLLGVPEEQAPVFRGEFLSTYFDDELRAGLTRSQYRFPEDLRVEIVTSPELPAVNEQWLTVDTLVTETARTEPPARVKQLAHLTVESGAANVSTFSLEKPRTNIGRTLEVYREGDGLSRRNDLAFDEHDSIGASVSREHAHIHYSAETGEYRLVNDRSYRGAENCGLYIIHEGVSRPVHRNSRGSVLADGDEIQLGQATLRFLLN